MFAFCIIDIWEQKLFFNLQAEYTESTRASPNKEPIWLFIIK